MHQLQGRVPRWDSDIDGGMLVPFLLERSFPLIRHCNVRCRANIDQPRVFGQVGQQISHDQLGIM